MKLHIPIIYSYFEVFSGSEAAEATKMASEAKKINCHFRCCKVSKYMFLGALIPFLKLFFGKSDF